MKKYIKTNYPNLESDFYNQEVKPNLDKFECFSHAKEYIKNMEEILEQLKLANDLDLVVAENNEFKEVVYF